MFSIVILSSGSGSRMNLGYNKMLYRFQNKMLIEHTIDKFRHLRGEILLVVNENDYENYQEIADVKLIIGGARRQDSVYNGVVAAKYDNVLIHDGARVNISRRVIDEVCLKMKYSKAVLTCVKAKDSIKKFDGNNYINLEREHLYYAQTPQAVKKKLYLECYNDKIVYTDDVSVVESIAKIEVVLGEYDNFKITTLEDLSYYKFLKEETNAKKSFKKTE